jgi:hypothetical protein
VGAAGLEKTGLALHVARDLALGAPISLGRIDM